MSDFENEIVSILTDYHCTNMTTLEVAKKHNIPRDDVLMWLEKEANGELNHLFFPEAS